MATLATLNCCLRQYTSSVRIDGRGRFLAVRAELNEETIMSFRNERFYRKFLPLDKLAMEIDLGKSKIASDGGRGAELIRNSFVRTQEFGERKEQAKKKVEQLREAILNANLKAIKPGAKKIKMQKEALVRLFDAMLATGADRDKTIVRLSKGYKLKKSSAERFYDRGLAMIKALLNP